MKKIALMVFVGLCSVSFGFATSMCEPSDVTDDAILILPMLEATPFPEHTDPADTCNQVCASMPTQKDKNDCKALCEN